MAKAYTYAPFVGLCVLLGLGAADLIENDGDWEIVEEEDEIEYTQKLNVDVPPIAARQSAFQKIEVYKSDHWGRVLVLDDNLQLTERDAAHYNEMLAHVPVMEYVSRNDADEPLRALVVGGGDGYVVSELLKYPNIASIDHVELDEGVIHVSREHLPWADAWKDDRVNLVVGDGAAFVQKQAEGGASYHVVIQDASDPFWLDEHGEETTLPSSVLYDTSHFRNMHRLLAPVNGVLLFQAETYNIPSNLKAIRDWRKLLLDIEFKNVRYGSISISTYPTGQIGFFVAHAQQEGGCDEEAAGDSVVHYEMDASPELDWSRILARFNELTGDTLYYHPRIHRSSFDLPRWVEGYIYGDGVLPEFVRYAESSANEL